MPGNKLELEIIGLFNRDINALLSINQISKMLDKAYPHINSKVKELIEEDILNKTEIGRSHLCSINLDDEKAIALLMLNEAAKKERLKIKDPETFYEEIKDIRRKFSVKTIVFHKKKLLFVLSHLFDKEAIKNLYSSINQFELLFLDEPGFKEFFLSNPDFSSYAILYSAEDCFSMIEDVRRQLFFRRQDDV